MMRVGVFSDSHGDSEALDELLEIWKSCPHVEMEGCFTHFCAADTEPDYTLEQNEVF